MGFKRPRADVVPGSPGGVPVAFLKALTQDPGSLHGVSDAALRFPRRGLTFVQQQEIRKRPACQAEGSHSVQLVPFLSAAL